MLTELESTAFCDKRFHRLRTQDAKKYSLYQNYCEPWSISGIGRDWSIDTCNTAAKHNLLQGCVSKANVVGGMAKWSGRQSLAGGLSIIYAWSMVDMWPLCD